jgi:uncharacterized protein (DUF1501 family)
MIDTKPCVNRRHFIRTSAAGAIASVGIGHAIGPWWGMAASAADAASDSGNILVVVQLSGGNDGLNTVIPFGDDAYRKNRLTLGYDRSSVLSIDDYLGWHPSARGMADLMEAGELSVVQGVGYPNPNRSHFESMDLWHTAHASNLATGWLGRFADTRLHEENPQSIYVGRGVRPLALQARQSVSLTVRALDQFQLRGGQVTRDIAEEVAAISDEDNDLSSAIASNLSAALKADSQLADALRMRNQGNYPGGALGRDLQQVATMIRANLPARVYYLTLDGFDTHANQRNAHAGLLDQLSSALKSFCDDLRTSGELDRVLVACFSEFGRRVKENGSQGTDHGVAGPMFFAGGRIGGSIVGNHPSLTDLDEGDLKYSIDYRSVYKTVLEDWLHASSEGLIAGQFEKVDGLVRA